MFNKLIWFFKGTFLSRSVPGFLKINRKTKNIIYFTLYVYITLVFCPYLNNLFEFELENDPYFFIYITFMGLCFNYINSYWTQSYHYLMVFSNFKVFLFKLYDLFINYYWISVKQFYLFFLNNIFIYLLNLFSKISTIVYLRWVVWSPLFKRTSYFSFYSSFRSKYIK